MPIDVRITDGEGKGIYSHIHPYPGLKARHNGMLVLQERFVQFNPEVHPFLNSTFGNAMNQVVTFGGTPEIIHNGETSTEWTATANAGTWDFADAGAISITNANNSDSARFESTYAIDADGYTTLTGKINLTTYNPVNNTIGLEFDLLGTPTGNSVDLDVYIDTGLIGTEQTFAIPKADIGLTNQDVDGFTITISRSGGSRPTMTFDDLQLEQTGAPIVFKSVTPPKTLFHITEIRAQIADNVTGIVTGSTTTFPTMPGLSYDSLLGVAALSTGIVVSRVQDGVVKDAFVIKQLGDFLTVGDIINAFSDGVNTFVTISIRFPEPIIMNGNSNSFISVTINDDLTGLLQFTASVRGAIEV